VNPTKCAQSKRAPKKSSKKGALNPRLKKITQKVGPQKTVRKAPNLWEEPFAQNSPKPEIKVVKKGNQARELGFFGAF